MTDFNKLPATQPGSDNFKHLTQSRNALGLDEGRLRELASQIIEQGLSIGQLAEVYDGDLVVNNALFSIHVGYAKDIAVRGGQDRRSFNRGAALAYFLIGDSAPEGVPTMHTGGFGLASTYRNHPGTAEALGIAADGILSSQIALSEAFDASLAGMPEGTDRDTARFGGGIVVLGSMAALQCGGSGIEVQVEE